MTNASGGHASAESRSPGGDGCAGESSGAISRAIGAVIAAVRPAVRSAAALLVEFFDRIVHGIGCLAPLAFGVACQSTADVAEVAPAAVQPLPKASVAKPEDTGPRPLGQFTITFYYVVGEDEVASRTALVAANDNRGSGSTEGGAADDTALAAIAPELVTLYAGGGRCEPIAEVSREFASQLAVQGTGKLRDGRVLNIWGPCNCKRSPCFKVTRAQWGTAGTGRPLQPFRTVAVDPKVIKLGSWLYVPLLEGRTMPGRQPWGGYIHDGCVIADDTGGHISGQRIDLFVGRRGYFLGLSGSGGSHAWARHVPVFDGTGICDQKRRQPARKAAAI